VDVLALGEERPGPPEGDPTPLMRKFLAVKKNLSALKTARRLSLSFGTECDDMTQKKGRAKARPPRFS